MSALLNPRGSVSRDGFACGYVDTSHGAGTRIEGSGAGYLARADGGHAILYHGPRLTLAREACRTYARRARRYWHGGYYCESVGTGDGYVARVRHFGVIIGTGATLAEAMERAEAHEADGGAA
jgi:hypothetical protein